MRLEHWDTTATVTYDHATLDEIVSLRFVDAGHNILILGPVGVGKTFLATAVGHIAIRRRHSVMFERGDRLVKRLRASRLDNSHDTEIRRLLAIDLLIIDDFCLQPLDPADTADLYEIIVERHRRAPTVITSNRDPVEWLALMADPLLAQSAIDRLQSAAYELILDGNDPPPTPNRPPAGPRTDPPTPRRAVSDGPPDHVTTHPTSTNTDRLDDTTHRPPSSAHQRRWHPNPVPCSWRKGGPIHLADDMAPTPTRSSSTVPGRKDRLSSSAAA
jgi:hypothetical protein